ncbi:hypothetical protein [Sphingomonas sp. MMS24-J13]|uniref:hypothetical protein n=1 Tax=Sphingomonas sp. MMS24-J13 TaxID=3238686 RepID=UPI00384B57DB
MALLFAAAPVGAQPLDFSATVDAHLGYAVNPQLVTGEDAGSGYGGITVSPLLSKATSVSQTTLGGTYSREQYFSNYGHTESESVTFNHNQTFSEYLRGGVNAGYTRSNNLLLNGNEDLVQLGNFATGGTTSILSAGANLSWQATGKDSFTADGNYIHQKTDNFGFSNTFDEYVADVGYMRALNARTKIGVRTNVTFYHSPIQNFGGGPEGGNNRTIGPALAWQQIISPIWNLDADVGIIFQHSGTPFPSDSKGLGFHARLCGTYPRSTICFSGARQSSGSAFGGLRQQLTFSVTYTYRLTELSSFSLNGIYSKNSNGNGNGINNAFADSDVFRGSIDYNRKLTDRLSVGVEGRGGYLKRRSFGSARSLAGSAYLRVKIG